MQSAAKVIEAEFSMPFLSRLHGACFVHRSCGWRRG